MSSLPDSPPIICLFGPTATGKTELAIELVERFSCEIISVDSAMVYRGMDIGTAKPTPEQLIKAPHRLINLCEPFEHYSAGQFFEDAQHAIQSIYQKQKIPLLVGGTMLYFWHLQQGLSELPPSDPLIREEILIEGRKEGWPVMHEKLSLIDPDAASRIHPNDSQRIQRALEVFRATGETLTDLQKRSTLNPPSYRRINLMLWPSDRTVLHQRIAQRFNHMLSAGFIDEVTALRARGDLNVDMPSMRSVGYRQVWCYLSGDISYEEMQSKGIAVTRQLAKRQCTWLRRWHPESEKNSMACDRVFDPYDKQQVSQVPQWLSSVF